MINYISVELLHLCPLSDCYRVVVQVYMGSHEHLCPVDLAEDGTTIGTVNIQRCTSWPEVWRILGHLLADHLHLVCGSWEVQRGLGGADTPLGLTSDSVASVKIGKPQKLFKKQHMRLYRFVLCYRLLGKCSLKSNPSEICFITN